MAASSKTVLTSLPCPPWGDRCLAEWWQLMCHWLAQVSWLWAELLCLGAALSPGNPCLQESFNLYGAHPFYLLMEEGGDAHGVFLLNSNAMGRCVALVQDLGARGSHKREKMWSDGSVIELSHLFPG